MATAARELHVAPEWKSVKYPNIKAGYQVSSTGQVKSPSGTILTPHHKTGHNQVSVLSTKGTNTTARVDKLVLSAFVGYEADKWPEHKNGDLFDDNLTNLFWREPTWTELRAAKGVRMARKAKAAKRAKAASVQRQASPARGKRPETLTVSRVYRRGTLTVTVDEQGYADLSKKNRLTTAEMAALGEIATAVAQMNTVMGLPH